MQINGLMEYSVNLKPVITLKICEACTGINYKKAVNYNRQYFEQF